MSVVWVTGAKGFIGSNLSIYLAQKGYQILGVGHGALPPEIAFKAGIYHWVNGEIDPFNLRQLLEKSGKPEVIFHLAGGSSVGLSLQAPAEDFRRTVDSTSSLLEWVRIYIPETKLVISSSAAIYGNGQQGHISEEGYYTPYSPYGFHKKMVELLCESYAHNFGLNISIVRLFSVYGAGLYKQLLWDLCCSLNQSPLELNLQGTGYETRDWLYIEDAVHLLLLAGNYASSQPFIINGGTGIATCVRDVVNILCNTWNYYPKISFSGKVRVGDPFSLIADTTKLKFLNFSPQYDLNFGVEKYVTWFKQL